MMSTVDPCNIRKILKIAGAHNWKNDRKSCPTHRRNCQTKCPSAENIYFKAVPEMWVKMVDVTKNYATKWRLIMMGKVAI